MVFVLFVVCGGCRRASIVDWTNDDYLFLKEHGRLPNDTQNNYVFGDLRVFPGLIRGLQSATLFCASVEVHAEREDWRIRITDAKAVVDGKELNAERLEVPTVMPPPRISRYSKKFRASVEGKPLPELTPASDKSRAEMYASFHAEREGAATNGTVKVSLFPKTRKYLVSGREIVLQLQ